MRGVKTLACLEGWDSSSWGKGVGLVDCLFCLVSLVLIPRTSRVNAPHEWCCRQDKERHSNMLTLLWLIRQNDTRSDKRRHSNSLTLLWLIRQNDKRSDKKRHSIGLTFLWLFSQNDIRTDIRKT